MSVALLTRGYISPPLEEDVLEIEGEVEAAEAEVEGEVEVA